MKCSWEPFLSILPPRLKSQVDKYGRQELQELRMRRYQPVEMVMQKGVRYLDITATDGDIQFVVNTASRYSPWSAATISNGYITAPGGHRIGLCGECVVKDGIITGLRTVSSVCIRIARDFPGIGNGLPLQGSLLILGPPGVGKTTLLRDLIRCRSAFGAVTVIDERRELFPDGQAFMTGPGTDVMSGCDKASGIEMALRTMGPRCIAVDEITALRDCEALAEAAGCGVTLLATAHAADITDLRKRPIYRHILDRGIFEQAVILKRDKSWYVERMRLCT